jgi:hypothetical protein
MYSKSRLQKFLFLTGSAALATFLISCLVSCTPKVGEQPPPQDIAPLSGTACISDTAETVKKFFKGDARDVEVGAGFDCISMAMQKFTKYVRGREEDRFDIAELAEFVENYFISKNASGQPTNRISPGLQNELMKIKQLFVGGSRQYVTRAELNQTIGILSRLRGLAVQANPFMKIYTLNWKISNDQNTDTQYFEGANEQLQSVAKSLAVFMLPNHQPYSFQDFTSLLTEISGFYKESWKFIGTIENYMPLIHKVKKAVAGGNEDSISPGEWNGFLLLGTRTFVQYLRYNYFLSPAPTSGSSVMLGYITREIEDLLSIFEDLVKQKPDTGTRRGNRHEASHRTAGQGRITRAELDELLTALSQVWPQFKVSGPMVDEAMVIKQVLFGGRTDDWSSDDFANARLKVVHLKPMLEKFFPYYSIYTFSWDPSRFGNEASQIYFKEAQDSLQAVMNQLGGMLEAPYSITHMYNMVHEVEKLYPTAISSESFDQNLKKYMPVVENIKNILYEDNGDEIRKAYWPTFLEFGSSLYSFYLNYHYFIQKKQFSEPRVLFALRYLIDSSMQTVDTILKNKPSKVIHHGEFLSLMVQLQKVGVLPADLKTSTLDSVTSALMNSLLNPSKRRLSGSFPGVFDKPVLDNMRNELSIWVEAELYLRTVFTAGSREISISPFQLQSQIDTTLLDNQIAPMLRTGLTELKKVLSSPVPLVEDSRGRLLISPNLRSDYTSDSVSRLNLTRAISRLLINGYAGDKKRIDDYTGVTKSEATQAFNDLKSIFVDMRFLSPDSTTFIDSRFLEANIFVPRGNGDDYASFLEISDLMNMILSGMKLDGLLRPKLLSECLPGVTSPGTSDSADYFCLFHNYLRTFPAVIISMPDFFTFMKNNEICDNEILFFNLIKAAGYVPAMDHKVHMGDIGMMPHVIQYLEMAFAKFDQNKDGVLDRPEAEKAFPIFEGLFRDLAKDYIKKGLIKDGDLLPLFTFVLKEGKVPDNAVDFLKFMLWKKKAPQDRNFTADRNKLASILGVVADRVSKTPGSTVTPPTYDTIVSHFSQQCQPRIPLSPNVQQRPAAGERY